MGLFIQVSVVVKSNIISSPSVGHLHPQRFFCGPVEVLVTEDYHKAVAVDFGRGNWIVRTVGGSQSVEFYAIGVGCHLHNRAESYGQQNDFRWN